LYLIVQFLFYPVCYVQGDGIVRDFQGGYSNYLDYRQDELSNKAKESNEAAKQRQENSANNKGKSTSGGGTTQVKPVVAKSEILLTPTSTKPTTVDNSSTKKTTAGNARKLTYEEKKELSKLEKEIKKIEAQIKDIRTKLNSSDGSEGYSVLADWSKEEQKLVELLESKELKWLQLSELES